MTISADQGVSSLTQTNIIKQLLGDCCSLSSALPVKLPKVEQIFKSRHLSGEPQVFGKGTDLAADLLWMFRADAIHNKATRLRLNHRCEDANGSGLSGSIGAKESEDMPGFQGEC